MADQSSSADRHAIVCNYIEGTNVVAQGARAYVIPIYLGGNLPERVQVRVRSRGGRWVTKWENMRRLDNFRLATLPAEHPRYTDEDLHTHIPVDANDVARLIRARQEVTSPAPLVGTRTDTDHGGRPT